MTKLAELIKSARWRLNERDDFAEGKKIFGTPFTFVRGSRCLEISNIPPIQKNTLIEQIYKRIETDTYVNRLISNGSSVVVKCFGISRRNARASNDLLCNHEIELRYLLIMTALTRAGVTDAATLPLAMYTTRSGKELCETGVLLAEQVASILEVEQIRAREGKPPRRYAVLFAESADCSLTDYLFRAPQAFSDYWLQSAVFQISLALAAVHSVFPTFRHNDLHASNILVQRIDPVALRAELGPLIPPGYPLVMEYVLGERRWQIDLDRAPFRCLLWDFSFASITAKDARHAGLHSVVPRVTTFGSIVKLSKSIPNQYCDIHKLADTLRWVLQQGSVWQGLSTESQRLLDKIVPLELSWAEKSMPDNIKAARQVLVSHASLQETSPTALLLWSDTFDKFRVDHIDTSLRIRPVHLLPGPKAGQSPIAHFRWPSMHSPVLFSSAATVLSTN